MGSIDRVNALELNMILSPLAWLRVNSAEESNSISHKLCSDP